MNGIKTMTDLFETVEQFCFICSQEQVVLWVNDKICTAGFLIKVGMNLGQLPSEYAQVFHGMALNLSNNHLIEQEMSFKENHYLVRGRYFYGDDGLQYSWWSIQEKEPLQKDSLKETSTDLDWSILGGEYREDIFRIYNALPPLMQTLEKFGCYDEMAYLNIAGQGAQHILKTTINLEEYCCISSNKLELQLESRSVSALLHDFVTGADFLVRNSTHQLILEEKCKDLYIQIDERKFYLILLNLLENSLLWSVAETPIYLTISRVGHDAVIQIRDIGDGIKPEYLSCVTKPFYSIDPSTGMRKGAGLGLYVALKLTEAHGGSMVLTSRPNEGTVVSIRIPETSVPPARKLHSSNVMGEMIQNKMSMLYAFLGPCCHVKLF